MVEEQPGNAPDDPPEFTKDRLDDPPEFKALQASLVQSVKQGGLDAMRRGTLVVLPSISFASVELRKIIGIQYYEERMMYTLLSLRNPDLRVVYITSVEVDSAIVDYYLDFLPDPVAAGKRLTMIHVGNPEPSALTGKILAEPSVIDSVRSAVDDDTGYIFPFNVTDLERRFAELVGIPLFGPHPDLVSLGSKSGSRQVARTAGVPVLPGREDIFSMDDLEEAVRSIKKEHENADAVVIKLNNGFSGQGNAIVDLRTLRFPIEETPTVFLRLRGIVVVFCKEDHRRGRHRRGTVAFSRTHVAERAAAHRSLRLDRDVVHARSDPRGSGRPGLPGLSFSRE